MCVCVVIIQMGEGWLIVDDNTGTAKVDTSISNLQKCNIQLTEGKHSILYFYWPP